MALLNTIASVSLDDVRAYRRDRSSPLHVTESGVISSFGIGGWTSDLGTVLNDVMLGGEQLDPSKDSKTGNRVHGIAPTRALCRRMEAAFRETPRSTDEYDDWVRSELGRIRDLLLGASLRGECVVAVWETFTNEPGRLRMLPCVAGPSPARRVVAAAGIVVGAGIAIAAWRMNRMNKRRTMA